jgi:hypothetical protein
MVVGQNSRPSGPQMKQSTTTQKSWEMPVHGKFDFTNSGEKNSTNPNDGKVWVVSIYISNQI